jgi:hypothetical protein
LEAFWSSYFGQVIIYRFGTALREGGHICDSDLVNLRGLYLRSACETSPSGLWQPDLSSSGVSGVLEASFIRAELLGTSGFQEGTVLIRVLVVWRGKTWHLDFILQGGNSLVPIYLLVKFGIV